MAYIKCRGQLTTDDLEIDIVAELSGVSAIVTARVETPLGPIGDNGSRIEERGRTLIVIGLHHRLTTRAPARSASTIFEHWLSASWRRSGLRWNRNVFPMEQASNVWAVRDVPRVASGSRVVVSLRPAANRDVMTVPATLALAKRGLSLLRAKRAIEEMLSSRTCCRQIADCRGPIDASGGTDEAWYQNAICWRAGCRYTPPARKP